MIEIVKLSLYFNLSNFFKFGNAVLHDLTQRKERDKDFYTKWEIFT